MGLDGLELVVEVGHLAGWGWVEMMWEEVKMDILDARTEHLRYSLSSSLLSIYNKTRHIR
jgi:hypothetical protein